MTTALKAAPAVRYLTIDESHSGQRVDNFLITALKGVPRTHIYRLLRKGEVRINKGRIGPDYRLQPGDVVRIPPVRTAQRLSAPVSGGASRFGWLEERVLYEDDALIALDKPAGMAVHGGSGVSFGVIEALRAQRPQARFLELVHRLDRDTSGCLLVAKKRSMLAGLHELLRGEGMDKRYLALVKGAWQGRARRVEAALEKNQVRGGERMVAVSDTGKESASRFTPRQVLPGATLMEIRLLTGRTHQARVHAAHIQHPIAGDDKYGDRDFNETMRAAGLTRLFLHAASLRFRHPLTGAALHLEAPLPPELSDVLKRLKHEKEL